MEGIFSILYLDTNICGKNLHYLANDGTLTEKVENCIKFKSEHIARQYLLNNLKYDSYCVVKIKK